MTETRFAGRIEQIDIEREMRGAYLDYAMSVIVSRALPDVRDGLKPVHRRILYAMYDMGLRPNQPYKKSARIVGEVLGKYHPHGDSAVYDAMARLAQDFSMRYPLVDGQGNFGSIDGDSPAAMRYTEARLAPIAMEMLADIDKETVDFVDNFDGSLQEPVVLPARIPNLLLNGASGIAVGMATNIPPHNLNEVADALIYILDQWERFDDISVDELMTFIKGPDFPTAARILGTEGIKSAYATGRGTITVRARAEIEELRGGRQQIVVTEIPYQVNKSSLIERMADLVRQGRLDQISDIRDETDRDGIRIVIELKRGAFANKVRNQLFKYTQLQVSYGINMLALVGGVPRVLPLKQMLKHYIDHRIEVIRRRTRFELDKAKARAHIVEGLLKALNVLDAVIETIRASASADDALTALIQTFGFSEEQARAILDMQLRRLAALERQKLEDEYRELQARIAYLTDLLEHEEKIRRLIREDLEDIKAKYGDERRTEIIPGADGSFDEEDLIPNVPVLVTLTNRGYIKRINAKTFRTQRRGGRGVKGMGTRGEDEVKEIFAARTHDDVLFFTNKGKVYQIRAYQIPDSGRTGKGTPLVNLINLAPDETVTAAIPVRDWDAADYLVMLTRFGRIKRVDLSAFQSVRSSGLIAIGLDEGDELRWVKMTHGNQELILVTKQGQAIRFSEEDVRPMGRSAAGVMAIRLEDGDEVAAMDVVQPDADLLIVTAHGYGKRVPLREFPTQSRYGKGVRAIARAMKTTGPIVEARVVTDESDITIISAEGILIRTKARQISQMGRQARGVRVMKLDEGDLVASLALLDTTRLENKA